MTKSRFKSKAYTSTEILEIVHTNLCGPIDVKSYKGDKYYILFFDDYSRMMTMMFLKEKSNDFQSLSRIWKELKRKQVKA